MSPELEHLYRDYGYWKVQEEIVKGQILEIGRRITVELSKPQKLASPEPKQESVA